MSICTMFKKFAKNWRASHELDVHIKKNRKLENAHGANNRILNIFNVCVIQQNETPKHHEVTPSRVITVVEELLCSWVRNYKNVNSLGN
jgi:hypothetical protein